MVRYGKNGEAYIPIENEEAIELSAEERKEMNAAAEIPEEQTETVNDAEKEGNDSEAALQLLMADFANYRKRVNKEKEELGQHIRAEIFRKLLPVIDDLERVLDHHEQEEENGNSMQQGIEMVYRNFLKILNEEGLEKIEAEGKIFDPNLHEAIQVIATTDPNEDQKIAHVAQPGYKIGNKILRHSKVVVKKYQTDLN